VGAILHTSGIDSSVSLTTSTSFFVCPSAPTPLPLPRPFHFHAPINTYTYGTGTIVNYELSGLRTAVVQATSIHRKGQKFSPPKQLATAFIEYTSGCCDGRALLSMIVRQ
jgi:hypothetical protein